MQTIQNLSGILGALSGKEVDDKVDDESDYDSDSELEDESSDEVMVNLVINDLLTCTVPSPLPIVHYRDCIITIIIIFYELNKNSLDCLSLGVKQMKTFSQQILFPLLKKTGTQFQQLSGQVSNYTISTF